MHNQDKTSIFSETQRPRQLWIWAFVLIAAAAAWYQFIVWFFVEGQRTGSVGLDIITISIWIAFGWVLPIFMAILKLEIIVAEEGVTVRFFPLLKRKIGAADIKRSEARTYRPILEYGGWGIRYGLKAGKAYNMSGNRGVQLVLKDGARVLLGSQQADQLASAIAQIIAGERKL